jgi:hypothetical protein
MIIPLDLRYSQEEYQKDSNSKFKWYKQPEFGISKTASSRKKDKKKRRQINWDRS